MCKVAQVLEGVPVGEIDGVRVCDISLFKYARLTSCDVERSFSQYKSLLRDNRHAFVMENLEMTFVVHCNSRPTTSTQVWLSKQSPVEELLRQADQLISTQKPRAEVYAAMAESLGLAWKDVNSHLEQRKLILDLNVAYQSRAEDCVDRMRALEIACQDSSLPVEIDAVKQLLTKLHDLKRLMLESLMSSLQDGKLLLEKLREISTQGTLDSRPDHIKTSSEYAISQVEHWLESLHDRRRLLEIAWQSRKTQLEQCLALALLATDLKELEEVLTIRKEAILRGSDNLGDSSSSAELLLHEHKKLLPEAKELQDRALKVTKATEQLVSSGHFAAEQATAQAYSILNLSAEYLDAIEQREALLSRAIAFFRSAHTALTKLDQLEVQLTTTKLSASSPQLIQLHSQVSKSLEEMTAAPLQEGYSLLETVGRGSPGIEGVKHTVEEIENRKIHLGELCTAHKEENVRLSQAFTSFLEKQNESPLCILYYFKMNDVIDNPADCEVRSVIRFLNARHLKPAEIYRQLKEVYGDTVMNERNVRKWCEMFNNGRTNVHDETRPGRPSLITEDLKTKVNDRILQDRRTSLDELHIAFPDISRSLLGEIVSQHLGYHKLCARWVPRQLSDQHKTQRMASALTFLMRYHTDGDAFLDQIVTGDET
ncbi:hypothetical protein ANN_21799 [Periplaneta americana]|uniref:Mos1 transposase HTH domain-containing protein n=1 Tax=Periplaneta americana TaxID=6978 RepID=A0ABQ8S6G6_PERAM|nr:hypothetical protein ANN_21799 [Periplaneta americana]